MYNESLQDALTSLKINEELKDTNLMASIYSRLYYANESIGDTVEAKQYALKYFEIAKELNDKKLILFATYTLARYYAGLNDWTTAQKYIDEAWIQATEQKNKDRLGGLLTLLASKEDYLKNYGEEKKYLLQNLAIWLELDNKGGITYVLTQLSQAYADLNVKDSAYYYANAAKEVSDKYELKQPNIYYTYYLIASTFHDYENALLYYRIYDSLKAENNNMLTGQKVEATKSRFEKEKEDALALKEMQRQELIRNGFIGGFGVVLVFAGMFFTQRNKINKGKKRSDQLLLNILPEEVAEELKAKGSADAKQFDEVTVMFTDFMDFTQASEKLSAAELVKEINHCYSEFDKIISKHNLEKIKTIGDSYMCAGGLPVPNKTNAEDTVKAALEICEFMRGEKQKHDAEKKPFFEIRIGCNTGPVVAGIVGIKKFAYDIWGDTVNIAARMEQNSEGGQINISGTTYELVKDKFNCTHRGKILAKHKGEIDMYFVKHL
jgi:class 3 adenylate cyclase